ncbi:hypothetical protein NDU88_004870 [Pleurodeles waltl]|uniref:Uncharacterized protein n=1 Tax=Pleurodeles waltl TaxID=8319 RepID=A0AAV7WA61_PLEWA|nr:hypothetical protein NDU88_004870 [Pleurodeles waltl]
MTANQVRSGGGHNNGGEVLEEGRDREDECGMRRTEIGKMECGHRKSLQQKKERQRSEEPRWRNRVKAIKWGGGDNNGGEDPEEDRDREDSVRHEEEGDWEDRVLHEEDGERYDGVWLEKELAAEGGETDIIRT